MRNTKGETTVYLDNYSVHHSKQMREFIKELIQHRILSAYISVLNPIEMLLKLMKGQSSRRMLMKPDRMSEEEKEKEEH